MIFMGFLIQFLNRYIPNKGKIEEIMMFRVKNQRVLVQGVLFFVLKFKDGFYNLGKNEKSAQAENSANYYYFFFTQINLIKKKVKKNQKVKSLIYNV